MEVEKDASEILKKEIQINDMLNMAFATTIIINRTCRRSSCRNGNEYKCWKNSKINYG